MVQLELDLIVSELLFKRGVPVKVEFKSLRDALKLENVQLENQDLI